MRTRNKVHPIVRAMRLKGQRDGLGQAALIALVTEQQSALPRHRNFVIFSSPFLFRRDDNERSAVSQVYLIKIAYCR